MSMNKSIDSDILRQNFTHPVSLESDLMIAVRTPGSLCYETFEEDLVRELDLRQRMEKVYHVVNNIADTKRRAESISLIALRVQGLTAAEIQRYTGLSRWSQGRRLKYIKSVLAA
tara:strand:- start:3323 stop:3667 length:345 start_codon:yes stop_codon:yes gene_type:complete